MSLSYLLVATPCEYSHSHKLSFVKILVYNTYNVTWRPNKVRGIITAERFNVENITYTVEIDFLTGLPQGTILGP